MSLLFLSSSFEATVGNSTRKLVLLKLADNADERGICWPSFKHIATQCEISRRSVIDHVNALEEMGVIRKVARKAKSVKAMNETNVYILNLRAINALKVKDHREAQKDIKSALEGLGVDSGELDALVNEVHQGGELGSPPLVNDVHHPSAGGSLGVVQELHPNLPIESTNEPYLVGEEKTEPADSVDSDEPTRSPRSTATENKKRFDGLAKVFNQVFADCNQVTKVSPQAKTVNKKRMALVPQAWAFGRDRVNHLAEQGLIPEANAAEVLAWFQRYFEICRDDPFINGTQPRGKGHENWKASFEYLMKITEIEKRILESE